MCAQPAADYRSPAERHIRNLLADGNVTDALDLLSRLLQDRSFDLFRESLLHAARNVERERQEQLGLLSAGDVRIERQRLIVSLLEFLDLIRDREIDLGPIPANPQGSVGILREPATTSAPLKKTTPRRTGARKRSETATPDATSPAATVAATTPTNGTPAVADVMKRDCVFVCYSHDDREWLERLKSMLHPLIRQNRLELWDDTRIPVGSTWEAEIQGALARAAIAVLLVSPHFLESSFILDKELPTIMAASSQGALKVVWIHVSDALFEETPIATLQAAHDAGTPLDRLTRPEQQSVLKKICLEIRAAVI